MDCPLEVAAAWDEFDALWDEETNRSNGRAPKLYEAIQCVGKEVDALRRSSGEKRPIVIDGNALLRHWRLV